MVDLSNLFQLPQFRNDMKSSFGNLLGRHDWANDTNPRKTQRTCFLWPFPRFEGLHYGRNSHSFFIISYNLPWIDLLLIYECDVLVNLPYRLWETLNIYDTLMPCCVLHDFIFIFLVFKLRQNVLIRRYTLGHYFIICFVAFTQLQCFLNYVCTFLTLPPLNFGYCFRQNCTALTPTFRRSITFSFSSNATSFSG